MAEEVPEGYRPMSELSSEGKPVVMMLRNGNLVDGWLFCGAPHEPRGFWRYGVRGSERIDPIAWREPVI